MDICRISEQDFLRFRNYINLPRYWKTVRLLTCTICDCKIEGVTNLNRHVLTTYLGTKPRKRGKKTSLPLTKPPKWGKNHVKQLDVDEPTVVEPWDLTPTSVKKSLQSY